MDGVMVLAFKKCHLEGKYREEFGYIALDILDAIFLPCPYLRGNIVIDGNISMAFEPGCYVEIETGLIDKDYHIGVPRYDIGFASAHVLEDGGQM